VASYRYKAANREGTEVAGALVADSPAEARSRLREMGLFPERIDRAEVGARSFDWLPGRSAKRASHVSTFTREFAVLLASGVPVVDALGVLTQQCEYAPLAAALAGTRDAVSDGRSLADGLAAHPRFFDASYVGMAASGEKGGTLEVVFARLADFLERRRTMRSKLSSSLLYPSVLVVMVIAVLMFLSGVVVPQIAPLLRGQDRPLPLATEALFAIGDFVRGYAWVVLLAPAVALVVAAILKSSPGGKRAMDRLALRIPLLGKVVRKSVVSRFAMSFGTLLEAGVPAVESLELLGDLTPNAAFAREIEEIGREVTEGRAISHRLQASSLFPPMVGYMVDVGERSGNLSQVLEHIARVYDTEVEIESRRLLAILEPALILVMALVVGFIAMSLMVTILELSNF